MVVNLKNLITKLSLLVLIITNTTFAAEDFATFLNHHVTNTDIWHLGPITIDLSQFHFIVFGVNMSPSLHVVMILLAGVLSLILFPLAAKRYHSLPTSKWGHAIEIIILFLKEDFIVPFLGEKEAKKWMPFILSLFFFLLILNLLGLIPYMGSATGNINFTAGIAIFVFLTFNLAGMVKNGPFHYIKNLAPQGTPAPVLMLLYPIEILGLFTKAVALSIRLFANLSAGHFVIFSLLGLIILFKNLVFAPAFVGFSLAVYILELFVAFLQAYVFTLLTTLFIGSAIHQEH